MSTYTKETSVQFSNQSPNYEALQVSLETARINFQALLVEVSEADWRRPSRTTRWSIGEILCHITGYLDLMVPVGLDNARKGKNMPKMPRILGNFFNFMLTRGYSRKFSRQTIGDHYEAVHIKALALLAGVQPDEWLKSTNLPMGRLNVTQLFEYHCQHLQLHSQDIRYGLNYLNISNDNEVS